ncbi:MAG: rod shape-determining protein MreC [Actinomycetota bacterium]
MYRRSGRGRLLLLLCLGLSIFLITLDFRQNEGGMLGRAKDLAVTVVAPIQRGFSSVTQPVGDLFASIGDLANIRSRNRRLEDDLDRLRQEIEEAEALQDENLRLREMFELDKSWPTMRTVTAAVFSKVPSNYQWAVLIDKGRADGIRPDMAVISPEGLVGKIIQADRNQATVLLLIDPDAAAGARVERERDTGVVRGNGGSEFLSLELIDPEADVAVGDEVVTSGYNRGVFPANIPIGVVAEVAGQEAALERQIRVESDTDFTALDFVSVLLDSGSENRRRTASLR